MFGGILGGVLQNVLGTLLRGLFGWIRNLFGGGNRNNLADGDTDASDVDVAAGSAADGFGDATGSDRDDYSFNGSTAEDRGDDAFFDSDISDFLNTNTANAPRLDSYDNRTANVTAEQYGTLLKGDGHLDGNGIRTERDDYLKGGNRGDRLEGLGGNDLLEGHGGNDMLIGGAGNDVLKSGSGNDELFDHRGSNVMQGGAGADKFTVGGLSLGLVEGVSPVTRNEIADFNPAADRLNISNNPQNAEIPHYFLEQNGKDTLVAIYHDNGSNDMTLKEVVVVRDINPGKLMPAITGAGVRLQERPAASTDSNTDSNDADGANNLVSNIGNGLLSGLEQGLGSMANAMAGDLTNNIVATPPFNGNAGSHMSDVLGNFTIG